MFWVEETTWYKWDYGEIKDVNLVGILFVWYRDVYIVRNK
jgi:hypothetical protein